MLLLKLLIQCCLTYFSTSISFFYVYFFHFHQFTKSIFYVKDKVINKIISPTVWVMILSVPVVSPNYYTSIINWKKNLAYMKNITIMYVFCIYFTFILEFLHLHFLILFTFIFSLLRIYPIKKSCILIKRLILLNCYKPAFCNSLISGYKL